MIVCLRTVDVPDAEREGFLAWIAEHEVFDAWIDTPDRDRLTASSTHQSVNYHPITRYDVAGGYLNLEALTKEQP